jgi:hypothetical protein
MSLMRVAPPTFLWLALLERLRSSSCSARGPNGSIHPENDIKPHGGEMVNARCAGTGNWNIASA